MIHLTSRLHTPGFQEDDRYDMYAITTALQLKDMRVSERASHSRLTPSDTTVFLGINLHRAPNVPRLRQSKAFGKELRAWIEKSTRGAKNMVG
jgi:hypothetical protein